jgi:hypothetical protein
MMILKAICTSALALLFACSGIAQIPTFQKKIGGTNTDEVAYHIIELSDGGFMIAGFVALANDNNRDALLLRLDAHGNVMWQRNYGGAGDDDFTLVTKGNDGGFLAMGETSSTGKGEHDVLLVKTDDNGNLLWSKTMGGTFDDNPTYISEILNLPDGYLVSGHQSSFIGSNVNGSFAVRLDNNGNIVWRHGYNTSHDNFIAGAYVEGNIAYMGGWAEDDACFAKIDLSNGNVLFSETLGGNQSESLFGIKPTQDGNLLLSDATLSPSGGSYRSEWVLKMTKGGTVLWSRAYTLDNQDFTGLALPTPDGGYLLGPSGPHFFATSGYLAKADSTGAIKWAYRYGGTLKNGFYQVIRCSDGGYIAVGNTGNHYGFDDDDILVVKVDANGLIEGCCPQPVDLKVQDFNVAVATNTFNLTTFTAAADWNPSVQASSLPSTDYCNSLRPHATYTLNLYPNQSFTIQGTAYTAPDTIVVQAPASPCDSLITYVLLLKTPSALQIQTIDPTCAAPASGRITVLNQPTATFSLNGGAFQNNPVFSNLGPGTYHLIVHNTQFGFDQAQTVVLVLNTAINFPTTLNIQCPADVQVQADPGAANAPVSYPNPVVTGDCPCMGFQTQLQQGLTSGSSFPVGLSTICYQVKDSCSNTSTCCFHVTVQESTTCDVKETSCLKFELLSITRDAQQRKTYRIRVTNHCETRLLYLAIQQPNGTVADLPANQTVFSTPNGHTYEVRNPNYAPFYSIRYSSLSDSIHHGGSDVFKYTLLPQADPAYIHVMAKLESQIYQEAYLNTFNCPVTADPGHKASDREDRSDRTKAMLVFPNPTNGDLFADLSPWAGETLQLNVFNAQGGLVHFATTVAAGQPQSVDLPQQLPNGLYWIVVTNGTIQLDQKRFVVQR